MIVSSPYIVVSYPYIVISYPYIVMIHPYISIYFSLYFFLRHSNDFSLYSYFVSIYSQVLSFMVVSYPYIVMSFPYTDFKLDILERRECSSIVV